MRRKVVAAAVLALSAAIANPAHATPGYREWLNVCGGNLLPGLSTCASVKLQVVGTSVTLWVKNLSGLYGSYKNFVFTSISFFNDNPANLIPDVVEGTVTTMTGPYRTSNGSNPPPKWKVKNRNDVGVFGLDFESGVNGIDGGIASNCANGLPGGSNDLWMTPACGSLGVTDPGPDFGWVKMTFSMKGAWDLDATNTQIQIHGQNNDPSVKCTTGHDCGPVDITPEPVTLALVGTGLAGLAGAYRRRRRREERAGDDETV